MARPRYGFFNEYPQASGGCAFYAPTARNTRHTLMLKVLPEMAERFALENGCRAGERISVEVALERGELVLRASLTGTCSLGPSYSYKDGGGARALESWDVSFSEVSAREAMEGLRLHNLLPVSAALLGKELHFLLPSSCVRQTAVRLAIPPISRPAHDAQGAPVHQIMQPTPGPQGERPEVRPSGALVRSGVVEPPQSRTLLLEGEDGEIVTYTLPRRVAEAVATLAAPYRS